VNTPKKRENILYCDELYWQSVVGCMTIRQFVFIVPLSRISEQSAPQQESDRNMSLSFLCTVNKDVV